MTDAGTGTGEVCIFCKALKGKDSSDLVLHRGEYCFVLLNKYPYNNGHLLVLPNRHFGALADSNDAELGELATLTRTAEIALTKAYVPQGINVGINLGRQAGAGVPGHLHVHLVPRWEGDTNFMTVVGETRVVPEELAQTVSRLRPIFSRLVG